MGLFDIFRGPDMHAGLDAMRNTPGAVLVDVRTPAEYGEGRIPGSINVPLQLLEKIYDAVEDKDAPVYVYCRSGARSRQAAQLLGRMGYTNVTNLGGILSYRGEVER